MIGARGRYSERSAAGAPIAGQCHDRLERQGEAEQRCRPRAGGGEVPVVDQLGVEDAAGLIRVVGFLHVAHDGIHHLDGLDRVGTRGESHR